MNGIVTGKQEKQAGSLVFKATRTFTLSTTDNVSISQVLTLEEVNNSYVKMVAQNDKIAIVSLYGLWQNPNYPTEALPSLRFVCSTNAAWPVECSIVQDRVYGTLSFQCHVTFDKDSLALCLKSLEIGTLE